MTEVELLTPAAPGAVAVVAVRGETAFARIAPLLDRPLPAPPGLRFARLSSAGEALDEVLVCVRSPTELELHLHGSVPLVNELIERLGGGRSRPRTVEERARRRLAFAPCELGARILLDQAEGALRRELERVEHLEGQALRAALDALLERSARARFVLRPTRIVLAGPVNAGKSTLFNAVVGRGRVIVSDEEGTTRDVIREIAMLGEFPVEWVDTAGERSPPGLADDRVEREGQARGRALRAAADLLLWLVPVDAPAALPAPEGGPPIWSLGTCADRVDSDPERWPEGALSARNDPLGARKHLERGFLQRFGLAPHDAWEAGAPVVFERAGERVLEGLREVVDGDSRSAALSRLLDGME